MKSKMTKRFTCLLLALVVSFSALLTMNTTTAYAGTNTQVSAIYWATSQLGKLLDYDHCCGAQCVDLITSYYAHLGVEPVKGNARDYANNALPYGWERHNYYNGLEPQPGDIIVWSRTNSRYGHVAILTSYNDNTFNVIEQCGRDRVVSYHSYPTSKGTLACFIRPNFSHSTDSRTNWYYDNIGWFNVSESGYIARNCWKEDYTGWCYLESNGQLATNCWRTDSMGWCYLDYNGHALTNTWIEDSYDWCYLGADGRIVTDKWIADSQGWCYVDSNGYILRNRWAQDYKGWCYLDNDGRMAYDTWKTDYKDWCYIDDEGYMVDDCWAKDSYDWCYLDNNGHITRKDWVEYSVGDSYLQQNGYITRHWMFIDNDWYYFGNNGLTQKGWADIDGDRYYFDETGRMAHNTFIGDDWVDESGRFDENIKPMTDIEIIGNENI